MYNNFGYPMNNYQPANKYEIIHVNGENGARALSMLPNSSTLLLDDTAPIIWLAMTDGAGYKTVQAYDIKPHTPEPEIKMSSIVERLERLEGIVNESNNTVNECKESARSSNANAEKRKS